MSLPRKRFRPLELREEQSLHSSDPLPVSLLDDERSYCFSWPTAALTAWISSSPAYAELHVYKSTAAAAAAADAATTSASVIVAPPTYSVAELLRGCGTAATDSARPPGHTKATGPAAVYSDVEHLLAPFADSLAIGSGDLPGDTPALPRGPATITVAPDAPRATAHPRAPPRPLCTGEDSIFSLSAEQLADAVAAGLLGGGGGVVRRRRSRSRSSDQDARAVAAAGDVKNETDKAAHDSGGELARRRRLEWEVVGWEWWAFAESRRTASALQRLLSLEAAVPFESGSRAPAPASGEPTEEWRRRVYALWLRWRLGGAGLGDGVGEGPGSAPPRYHPWGPPLMPGAYLYDTQPDYFLNPARTSAVAVAVGGLTSHTGAPPGGALDGSGRRRRRGPYGFLGWRIEHYTPQLQRLVDSGGLDLVRGTGDDGPGPTSDRPGRPPARGELAHPAFDPVPTRRQQRRRDAAAAAASGGGGGGGAALLSGDVIEALVRSVVLASPLVDVELDGMGTSARMEALEWADLKRDTDMWRTWLSKVEAGSPSGK